MVNYFQILPLSDLIHHRKGLETDSFVILPQEKIFGPCGPHGYLSPLALHSNLALAVFAMKGIGIFLE
jgi:hypothetical protein